MRVGGSLDARSACPPAPQNVTAGANPISIKRGIDKTCDYLVGDRGGRAALRLRLKELRRAALRCAALRWLGGRRRAQPASLRLPPCGPRGRPDPPDPPPRRHPPAAAGPQVSKLKDHARPVKGSSEIKSVAAISAGNDDEIGQMIADALDKVGAGGCGHGRNSPPPRRRRDARPGAAAAAPRPPFRPARRRLDPACRRVGADGVLAAPALALTRASLPSPWRTAWPPGGRRRRAGHRDLQLAGDDGGGAGGHGD